MLSCVRRIGGDYHVDLIKNDHKLDEEWQHFSWIVVGEKPHPKGVISETCHDTGLKHLFASARIPAAVCLSSFPFSLQRAAMASDGDRLSAGALLVFAWLEYLAQCIVV